VLRTDRLLLRGWTDADRAPYAAMNADPEVMRYFPSTLTPERSDAHVDHIARHFAEHGFGLWAVEVPGEAPFIGFVGLDVPTFDAHFTPTVEIGWRLAQAYWRRGYATEAARAVLDDAFGRAGLAEVVSMTAVPNEPSQRVMQRLGMHRDPADDFEHPNVAPGHWLRHHVLYRITAEEWQRYRSGTWPSGARSSEHGR
jgi:ribosomal-protein-alanine N-acetyltransferase